MAILGACKILSFAADNASSPVLTVQRSTNAEVRLILITAANQTNILETSFNLREWYPVLVFPATNQTDAFEFTVTNSVIVDVMTNSPGAIPVTNIMAGTFYRVVSAPSASSKPPAGYTNIGEANSAILYSTAAAISGGAGFGRGASLFQANQLAAAAAARTEFQRSNQNNYAEP